MHHVCVILTCLCHHLQQRDSSRGRHREKEDIKITKERTPASEEEPTEWETNREGSLDFCVCLVVKFKFKSTWVLKLIL